MSAFGFVSRRRSGFARLPMLPAPLAVTVTAARRFVRRALLLDAPAPTVADALEHHGYLYLQAADVTES